MKQVYQKGFTLIELLIVVAILGVMAAAVLLAMDPAAKIKSAKDANVKSDMGQLVNALQAYYTGGNQIYPLAGNGAAVGLGALIPSEIKSLPSQQSGFTACAASPNGGNTNYTGSYCYTSSTDGAQAAIWGTLFAGGTSGVAWCWDSTNSVFRTLTSTTRPTQASPTCPST